MTEGWIEDEVILAYFKQIVLAHRRDETLLVTPENFVYADNPTSWPPEEGEISLLTQPIFLANWQYALIPIWNNHHWFLAVAFRQNGIVRVFDTKRGDYLNNVFDRLNRIATLLFGMTQFTIVAANPSTFFDQRDGWSCGVHVCIIANRIMSANDPFNCDNLLYDMHAVRQWKKTFTLLFRRHIDAVEATERRREDHQLRERNQRANESAEQTIKRLESQRVRQRQLRANESADQTTKRRESDRLRHQTRRANESADQTTQRRESDRLRHQDHRANESVIKRHNDVNLIV